MEVQRFQSLILMSCLLFCGVYSLPVADNGENAVIQLKQIAGKVAAATTDEELSNFIKQLSPEDQAVLQHMQYKLKYLLAAVNEPAHGPNPGDDAPVIHAQKKSSIPSKVSKVKEFHFEEHKRSDLIGPSVPAEESDPELQAFKQSLSPEDQALLMKMSYKLKFLQGTLHEPAREPNPNEAPDAVQTMKKSQIPGGRTKEFQIEEHKRSDLIGPSVPAEESDPELQAFKQSLSPEDQALLKKMSYKLKYLQGVLHEPEHRPNSNEAPNVQIKREQSVQPVQELEDDIKNTHLKMHMTDDTEGIDKNTDGAVIFTEDDRQMLQSIRVKLDELKKSLQEFKISRSLTKINEAPQEKEVKAAAPVYNPTVKGEGEFGHFVQIRTKRGPDSHWHDAPVDDTILGLVQKCENCVCEGIDCDCHSVCAEEYANSESKLSKRVLSKLNSATSGGINLKELLGALSHVQTVRKRRNINGQQKVRRR